MPPISTYLINHYSPQGGIGSVDFGEVDFVLDECESCGLVYQRMIPVDSLMKKLYEEWIDPETSLHSTLSAWPVEYFSNLAREMNLLIRHFETVPSALDFLISVWGGVIGASWRRHTVAPCMAMRSRNP